MRPWAGVDVFENLRYSEILGAGSSAGCGRKRKMGRLFFAAGEKKCRLFSPKAEKSFGARFLCWRRIHFFGPLKVLGSHIAFGSGHLLCASMAQTRASRTSPTLEKTTVYSARPPSYTHTYTHGFQWPLFFTQSCVPPLGSLRCAS